MLALILLGGCGDNDDASLYYTYDGDPIVCGMTIDDSTVDFARLHARLAEAASQGWVLNIYAHRPGDTVSRANLDRALAMVQDAGMPFVAYRELASLPHQGGAGVALSFDDNGVDSWYDNRDILDAHGATATYFVSRYPILTAEEHVKPRLLADPGHDIESHTVDHLDAVDYAAAHGVQAYVDDEVVPEIEALRAAGYDPRAFAYPFGSRSTELDDAILPHASILRTTPGACPR